MTWIHRAIAVAVLVGSAGLASAATIQVSQESSAGAGDFDANVLGVIDAFETALTIADFYQYSSPDGASYNGDLNGGPSPISGTTQMFFVLASDGLNLVTVHDTPSDGSGGSTRMTTTLAGGAGGSAAFTVKDDPSEGTATSDVGVDRIFDTVHNWVGCCTDGYAIGDLGSAFTLFSAFDLTPTGILSWIAVDDGGGSLALVLDPERRVRFTVVDGVVPLPAPAVLLLGGLAALGATRRLRRKG